MKSDQRPVIVRITPVFLTIPAIFDGQNRYLKNNGLEVHVITSPDANAHRVSSREGFYYHPVPISRKMTPISDFKSVLKITSLLKQISPDIVHTHTSKGGLVGMLGAALAGTNHRVHTIAGWTVDTTSSLQKAILSVCEKITLQLATNILVNSASLCDALVQTGYLHPKQGTVLGHGSSNGIDLQAFSRNENNLKSGKTIRQHLGIQPEDIVIVFMGRIMLEKGIAELLEAFLSLDNDRVHMLLLGSIEHGSRKILPELIMKTIKNHPRIHLTGWTDEVASHLAAADILAHPSHHEGLPNALLQGAAMELPCIAANVRGSRDVILDGETGYLVPVRSPESLASTLSILIKDRMLRNRLGIRGRKFVENNFDRKKVCANLLAFYNGILSTKPRMKNENIVD